MSGKVAIVTGGSEGIGRGIALEFAKEGWRVAVANRRPERGKAVVEEIKKVGGEAIAVKTDVAVVGDINRLVDTTVEAFGRVDVMINNAGIYPPQDALVMSEEEWDQVIDTNLKGSFFGAQAAARRIIEHGEGGSIINISSSTAFRPTRLISHYAAAKMGLIGLTKVLALELADYKITVNSIVVGIIRTDTAMGFYGQGSEEHVQAFLDMMVPLKREGMPEDIAHLALFLASPKGSYITGAALPVDGGFMA